MSGVSLPPIRTTGPPVVFHHSHSHPGIESRPDSRNSDSTGVSAFLPQIYGKSRYICGHNAINLIETNIDKINWFNISSNPSIFEIDYNAIKKRIEPFIEELMMKCYHPEKLYYFLTKYNYDIGSDEYINEEN